MAPPPRLLWSGGIFLAVKNSLEGPEWPGRPGPDTRIPGYGQGTNSGLSSAPAQGPGHKNFPLLETNDPEMFQSIQDWLGKKTNWEINIAYFDTSTFIYKALFLRTSLSLKHYITLPNITIAGRSSLLSTCICILSILRLVSSFNNEEVAAEYEVYPRSKHIQ